MENGICWMRSMNDRYKKISVIKEFMRIYCAAPNYTKSLLTLFVFMRNAYTSPLTE